MSLAWLIVTQALVYHLTRYVPSRLHLINYTHRFGIPSVSMILVFYQLRGVAQHSKIPTGGLYLLNMGLQVPYKFWKTVSALLRFGNMKSLEMSRLNHSL